MDIGFAPEGFFNLKTITHTHTLTKNENIDI